MEQRLEWEAKVSEQQRSRRVGRAEGGREGGGEEKDEGVALSDIQLLVFLTLQLLRAVSLVFL